MSRHVRIKYGYAAYDHYDDDDDDVVFIPQKQHKH